MRIELLLKNSMKPTLTSYDVLPIKENFYKCNLCEITFLTQRGINIHKGKMHKKLDNQICEEEITMSN